MIGGQLRKVSRQMETEYESSGDDAGSHPNGKYPIKQEENFYGRTPNI